jgi:hypothetical protein
MRVVFSRDRIKNWVVGHIVASRDDEIIPGLPARCCSAPRPCQLSPVLLAGIRHGYMFIDVLEDAW